MYALLMCVPVFMGLPCVNYNWRDSEIWCLLLSAQHSKGFSGGSWWHQCSRFTGMS